MACEDAGDTEVGQSMFAQIYMLEAYSNYVDTSFRIPCEDVGDTEVPVPDVLVHMKEQSDATAVSDQADTSEMLSTEEVFAPDPIIEEQSEATAVSDQADASEMLSTQEWFAPVPISEEQRDATAVSDEADTSETLSTEEGSASGPVSEDGSDTMAEADVQMEQVGERVPVDEQVTGTTCDDQPCEGDTETRPSHDAGGASDFINESDTGAAVQIGAQVGQDRSSSEHLQLVVTDEQATLAAQQWEAVGGLHNSDILVHEGQADSSNLLSQRLSTDAEVEELATPTVGWSTIEATAVQDKVETSTSCCSVATDVDVQTAEAAQQWEVVGGVRKGGILVREGQSNSSTALCQRLCAGAVVQQIALNRTRLHFRLISGVGPTTGWVSISHHGQKLLVRRSAKLLDLSLDSSILEAAEDLTVSCEECGDIPLEATHGDVNGASEKKQAAQWEVTGGLRTGGILAREGPSSSSPALPQRLSAGAVVRELAVEGGRMHFLLDSGVGPATGWVAMCSQGRDLLIKRSE
eukprot:gnl/TRDRNA2_/TRDRNA2_173649_c1_seq3.p1 gnl/TRDRNA2_/TRDRNA2_173649_c1~~gnl/TRDRNA2_/TRDRNA2_173649_c1_seq3.p1  ORF type:complete len:547 (-),score=109.32 gnl/TRDRNA2_/TRDRNA2_173649_c1_seq3:26-1591(-)